MKAFRVDSRHPLIKKLSSLYKSIFSHQSTATATNLLWLALSTLVFNSCSSIYFSYKHFLRELSDKCLNAFYYTMNESNINCDDWMREIVTMATMMIPEKLAQYPIMFAFDDSLVEKKGDCFEAKAHLFDHTARNGSSYIDGHCFVSLLMMVPVLSYGKVIYVPIPVAHRMWTGEKTKLEIAAELVLKAYTYANRPTKYIVLCDSWYPKAEVCDLSKVKNIELICSVRSDTALYLVPEKKDNGTPKKGRPRDYGDQINIEEIRVIDVEDCDYNVGYVWVKTKLFGSKKTILAIVTEAKESKTRRLFLCTDNSVCENFDTSCLTDKKAIAYIAADKMFTALAIYSYRWNIEKVYFELKTFWNFREYKLRSRVGIERVLNLQTLTYALLSMLPYLDNDFSSLDSLSMQERRFVLGRLIDRQLFFELFVENSEHAENTALLERAYEKNSLGGSAA